MAGFKQTARKYHLPINSTPLELSHRFAITLRYGPCILVAGYFPTDNVEESWFGAAYKFTSSQETYESGVELVAISEEPLEDEGHAIANMQSYTYWD